MVKACNISTLNQLKNIAAPALPHELLGSLINERVKVLDSRYSYEMLGIAELRQELNCGRDAVYSLLASNKIKSETIGKKRMVTKLALATYLVNTSM